MIFFYSYKKCYNFCYSSFSYYSRKDCIECIKEFCKKDNNILKRISKIYFNIVYIKFFYLLQKKLLIKLYLKIKSLY